MLWKVVFGAQLRGGVVPTWEEPPMQIDGWVDAVLMCIHLLALDQESFGLSRIVKTLYDKGELHTGTMCTILSNRIAELTVGAARCVCW
jgi:hypothetical protein